MPNKEFEHDQHFAPEIDLPSHLKHKPVYAMPYQKFDGIYKEETDARYLSVGFAQWDNKYLSLKVMRHTGTQWSRQAEELPLHRVIDGAIFLAKVILDDENDTLDIESNSFEDQDVKLQVLREDINSENEVIYKSYMDKHGDLLKRRLNALHKTLVCLKTKGKF